MLDLAQRYTELAAGIDGAGLPSPYDLRRFADRRSRRRSALLAGAGVVVVAGTTSTGIALVGGDGPAPLPGPSPTPTASTAPATPSPSPTPPPSPSNAPPSPSSEPALPPVTEIPNRAFFELPEDYRRYPQRMNPVDGEAVPGFCDDALAPGGRATVRRSTYWVYQEPGAPADYVPFGSIFQTITGYRDGGAEAFMDRLRAAADDCDTYDQDGTEVTYRVADPPDAGDEAIYLVRAWPRLGPDKPSGFDSHIVVVRVGDVVTILFDRGWEGSDSEREYVELFVEWSVSAIEAWR